MAAVVPFFGLRNRSLSVLQPLLLSILVTCLVPAWGAPEAQTALKTIIIPAGFHQGFHSENRFPKSKASLQGRVEIASESLRGRTFEFV